MKDVVEEGRKWMDGDGVGDGGSLGYQWGLPRTGLVERVAKILCR